jgi:hypothetical protein
MWKYEGGIKPEETVRLVGQFGPCLGSDDDDGFSVLKTEQNESGLVAIRIGQDAICTSRGFMKGRPATRTQLAGLIGYVRTCTLDKMGVSVVDVASMSDARINSVTVQTYLCELWREKHGWEVNAKSLSQGLPGGVAVQWWALFDGDDDYMMIGRGSVPAS